MPTLRRTKGCALTIEELDANFEGLDGRLRRLETRPERLEGLQEVVERDGKLIFKGSQGSVLGEVPLPTPKVAFKGAWRGGVPYAPNDLASHEGRLYVCRNATTTATFQEADWRLVLDSASSQGLSSEERVRIPTYVRATLPSPELGALAVLATEDAPELLYGDGQEWRRLQTAPFDASPQDASDDEDDDSDGGSQ